MRLPSRVSMVLGWPALASPRWTFCCQSSIFAIIP